MRKLLLFMLLSTSVFAQGTISHIIIIIKENRSFDHYFGGFPGVAGFSNASSPAAACNRLLSASCPTGTVSLVHGNPKVPDGDNGDLPHSRRAIVDSIDGGLMDGYGGFCSGSGSLCWWNNRCGSGGKCIIAGSVGASGGYTYFSGSDIPFYWQLAARYGLADHYFTYATPSYPDHLALIAAQSSEAVDNPYTPRTANQWTCDEAHVSGSAPVCKGTSCTGGYIYNSQVLSIARQNEKLDGISINQGHYYTGGVTKSGAACICDQGTTLPVTITSCTNSGTTCAVPSPPSSARTPETLKTLLDGHIATGRPAATSSIAPSVGSTPGSLCPNITTVLDLMDSKTPTPVTWGYYAPTTGHPGYWWNAAAYVAHIRYGKDWAANVHDSTQFDNDVANNTLPQVAWLSAPEISSEHPGKNMPPATGIAWTQARLTKIFENPTLYNSSLICIVWDDAGGFYDHLPVPTAIDSVGYGPRAPLLCVGPYVKNKIASIQYEPASLIRCIEDTFRLPHTLGKDATATSICPADNLGMVDLTQLPIPPPAAVILKPEFLTKHFSAPRDVVSGVAWLAKRLSRREYHPEEEKVAENIQPQLATERPCFEGTKPHKALYRTSKGLFSVEICGSDDGKMIFWRGQDPMDADEPDEPPRVR